MFSENQKFPIFRRFDVCSCHSGGIGCNMSGNSSRYQNIYPQPEIGGHAISVFMSTCKLDGLKVDVS